MEANYHFVSEISPISEYWILRVRVARIWTVPNMVAENVPNNIEIVFIDQRGDKISATASRYLMDKFKFLLKEGCIYFISNFKLTPNIGSYRATTFPHKIIVTNNTDVWLDHCFIFPTNIFTFTPPPQIFGDDYNTDVLADVIGVLTAVGVEITNGSNTNRSRKVHIELDSYGFRFRCTLFGQYVDQLHSFLSTGNFNVVVAIMCTKVKSYGGVKVIQTTRESSKLIFNPNIRETMQLRNSQNVEDRWTTLYEEFILKAPRSNIAHLGFSEVVNSVAVLGTIDEIIANHGWCHYVVNIKPRYLLNVRVVDDSGVSNFVICDDVATIMLNINCSELVEVVSSQNRHAHFVPPQIMDLVGKEFLFMVRAERDMANSSNEHNHIYRVIDCTNDSEIVDLFKGHTTHKETAEQNYQMHDDVVFDIEELLDSNNIPRDSDMLEYEIYGESDFQGDDLLKKPVLEELQDNDRSNSYETDFLDVRTETEWWDNLYVDMSDSSDKSVTSPMSKNYK
ncbi:replication factor A protein [Trifolium repens]|nr:replication factor A protein [Trifolium repens]